VAHVGKEFAFCLACRVRLVNRVLEFYGVDVPHDNAGDGACRHGDKSLFIFIPLARRLALLYAHYAPQAAVDIKRRGDNRHDINFIERLINSVGIVFGIVAGDYGQRSTFWQSSRKNVGYIFIQIGYRRPRRLIVDGPMIRKTGVFFLRINSEHKYQ